MLVISERCSRAWVLRVCSVEVNDSGEDLGRELNECASERPWFDDVNIFAIIKESEIEER